MTKPALKIFLADPRGFCAGVVRAIEIVETALTKWGAPVYVRHEIVHNKHVVDCNIAFDVVKVVTPSNALHCKHAHLSRKLDSHSIPLSNLVL